YAVQLSDVLAEMTATTRVGVHRYTFSKGTTPHLRLDVTSALGDKHAERGVVKILPDAKEIEGSCREFGSFSGRYKGLDAFFVARFSKPFASYATWTGESISPNTDSASGDSVGVDCSFAIDDSNVVEVRVGISYVSIANARANLDAEAGSRSFDEIAAEAQKAWDERLSAIHVTGGTEEQQRVFYTSLYRSMQMPTTFSDTNGEYRGFDFATHKAEGFTYYTDFSLWDTFRTVHPLYNLIARKEQRDMMVSLVEMGKAGGGALPRWPSGTGYTNCMFGTPADIAVTDAYLKGIREFDIETAYAMMRQVALVGVPLGCEFGGRNKLQEYRQYGYCPSDIMNKAVSATLEYGYADYALMLLARELGHEDDAKTFETHVGFYKNLWNPDTQFFQPKDSQGNWFAEFRPLALSYTDFDNKYTDDYVEGSPMQWRWAVPFDAEGLVSLFSSREYFVSELDTFFAKARKKKGYWHPGSYYWHGNEPALFTVYLFNAAGRPDLTQKWVRWLLDTRYGDDYVGLDGNNDAGTLSAWYVFSALGFYPIAGSTRYELGAPLFERAEVKIGDRTLTIKAENFAAENIYVQRVTLNGTPLDRTHFTHDEIANGGELVFEMGASPKV
ncbi:MAG: GH92 family glycosyl hydrolase, partial [Candidatus Hydrogenedentes bacterium]|nr:GH92 family glycosyl hydrolase [Candidatus Hydrogenedentota bacterium]